MKFNAHLYYNVLNFLRLTKCARLIKIQIKFHLGGTTIRRPSNVMERQSRFVTYFIQDGIPFIF